MDEVAAYEQRDLEMFFAPDEAAIAPLLEERSQAELRIKELSVSEDELYRAITGGDEDSRQAAAIVLVVRRSITERLFEALLARYEASKGYSVRQYAIMALSKAEPELLERHSKRLADLMRDEANDSLRLVAVPLVARLPRSDSRRVFVRYLETGAPRLGKPVYATAWTVGHGFACEVRAEVVSRNRSAAALIREIEHWARQHGSSVGCQEADREFVRTPSPAGGSLKIR